MNKLVIGVILIVIGLLVNFAPILQVFYPNTKTLGLDTFSDGRAACGTTLGEILSGFNVESLKFCQSMDFWFYASIIAMIVGVVLILIGRGRIDKKPIRRR
jgi:uncharacterized membrane protein YphA (DoxX/SURF4 family)